MNLIPWRSKGKENGGSHALSPLGEFRTEMNRLFDHFFHDPFSAASQSLGDLTQWSPSLDVAETDKDVTVRAEIPGVDPKDLDIQVSGNRLRISGEKKETSEKKEQSFYRRESYYGSFTRDVELPPGVDAEKVDADYKGGVLTVHLNKMPGAAAKKIPVKTS
ncbi:MAG TPA: Hsp20/alpha crystallin family protein [Pirellulales bacterium]|jgi:HSP20 family protein|nr:Hsp20/alpha crystallin family protein [Pirellulales bacterium]